MEMERVPTRGQPTGFDMQQDACGSLRQDDLPSLLTTGIGERQVLKDKPCADAALPRAIRTSMAELRMYLSVALTG
jgi:hypothetical protein